MRTNFSFRGRHTCVAAILMVVGSTAVKPSEETKYGVVVRLVLTYQDREDGNFSSHVRVPKVRFQSGWRYGDSRDQKKYESIGTHTRYLLLFAALLPNAAFSASPVAARQMDDEVTIETFPSGNGAWALAFDGANIWVTDNRFSGGTVTKLRASEARCLAPSP